MEYGICNLGIVSVRIDGNDRSEIVTQLLFGEHFKILEETENWIIFKPQKTITMVGSVKNNTKRSPTKIMTTLTSMNSLCVERKWHT